MAVRFHVTLASGTSSRRAVDLRLNERAFEALRRAQLLRRLPRARTDVAGAMDPCLRRDPELGIAVDPLGIVGREHVRLDPERGEVLRELERALHAPAAGWREVHRDQEDAH